MIGCHEHPPCTEADSCEGCMYDEYGNSVNGDMDCFIPPLEWQYGSIGIGICYRNDMTAFCQSSSPTPSPTPSPTVSPSSSPTPSPTPLPTSSPTSLPTHAPLASPTP